MLDIFLNKVVMVVEFGVISNYFKSSKCALLCSTVSKAHNISVILLLAYSSTY